MLKSWRIKQDVLGEALSALLNTSWLQHCLSAPTGPHSNQPLVTGVKICILSPLLPLWTVNYLVFIVLFAAVPLL